MKRTVFIASFLLSFSIGIAAYINSSFIETFSSKSTIGIIYAASALLGIFALSRAGVMVARIGAKSFFFVHAVIQIGCLALIAAPVPKTITLLAFVGYLTCVYPLAFCLDVFFAHVMPVGSRGKTRGIFLFLSNLAWLCTPFAGIALKERAGFQGIYICALGIVAIIVVCIGIGFSSYVDAKYTPHRSRFSLFRSLKKARFRPVIFCNFLLQFFYSWMVVYSPIYLHEYLSFSWRDIAIMFTAMLSSFVILDYPLGRIADWLGSEKEFTALGFLCMIASLLGLFIFREKNIFVIGGLLALSRVGAASVEAMTEIHFFKIAKDSDPDILCVFRDLSPASYLIAPLIGGLLISVLPFHFLFGILGVILIAGFVVSLRLEKNTVWGQRAHAQ